MPNRTVGRSAERQKASKESIKFSFTYKLILFLFLGIFFKYENPSSSDTERLPINMISITDGDSLNNGAGILIRFSKAIEENSFRANSVEKSINITYADCSGLKLFVSH
jgi:hypothetical protein